MWQPQQSPLKSKNLLRNLFPTLGERAQIIGILNCTPDSFSDGGIFADAKAARDHARALAQAGADGIDIGAESTRPGAPQVDAREQWRRLSPLLVGLPAELKQHCGRQVAISIDTRSREVAEKALNLGADWVNDVSGGSHDSTMLDFLRERGCPCVLMHSRGTPETMHALTDYGPSFIKGLHLELESLLQRAVKHGIQADRIVLDPGLGFAKNAEQNFQILSHLNELRVGDTALLVGPSRKSFLRRFLGDQRPTLAVLDQLTLAASLTAIAHGAEFIRLHNVGEILPAVRYGESAR